MAESSYRRDLIRLVTFLGGVYFFLEFLFPQSLLDSIGVSDYHSHISNGFIVVGTMAIGLGIINLFMVHGTKVVFQRKDWFFSLVLLVGLVFMMFVTFADWFAGQGVVAKSNSITHLRSFAESIEKDAKSQENIDGLPAKEVRITALVESVQKESLIARKEVESVAQQISGELSALKRKQLEKSVNEFYTYLDELNGVSKEALLLSNSEILLSYAKKIGEAGLGYQKILREQYDISKIKKLWIFLYEGLFVSLGSAMFSLLGVYIASAAYRAFRIKTVESFLMMLAAIIVMLGQIPFYEYISYSLPDIRQWLLEVPNAAAFRAIKIGAAIAGLVMAFRMWFSIESESFSREASGGKKMLRGK